jgi:hypothetical protein
MYGYVWRKPEVQLALFDQIDQLKSLFVKNRVCVRRHHDYVVGYGNT